MNLSVPHPWHTNPLATHRHAVARAAINRGDLAVGSALLREATVREPGNVEAWLNLGIIAVRQSDWGNAQHCDLVARQLGHPQAVDFLVWLRQRETSGKKEVAAIFCERVDACTSQDLGRVWLLAVSAMKATPTRPR